MGSVVVVLSIIGLIVLFAYLKFPPRYYANKKLVRVYDLMVMGVCALLILTWVLNLRAEWMDTVNEKWWEPMAIIGALGIEIILLGLFFILRNFWIFKPPRRPGGGFGF